LLALRTARRWISQRKGTSWGKGPKLERDENGWIKPLEADRWAETPLCTIRGGRYPPAIYVCLYEGEGKIEFGSVKRVISSKPGRIVFQTAPGGGSIWLRIRETSLVLVVNAAFLRSQQKQHGFPRRKALDLRGCVS